MPPHLSIRRFRICSGQCASLRDSRGDGALSQKDSIQDSRSFLRITSALSTNAPVVAETDTHIRKSNSCSQGPHDSEMWQCSLAKNSLAYFRVLRTRTSPPPGENPPEQRPSPAIISLSPSDPGFPARAQAILRAAVARGVSTWRRRCARTQSLPNGSLHGSGPVSRGFCDRQKGSSQLKKKPLHADLPQRPQV